MGNLSCNQCIAKKDAEQDVYKMPNVKSIAEHSDFSDSNKKKIEYSIQVLSPNMSQELKNKIHSNPKMDFVLVEKDIEFQKGAIIVLLGQKLQKQSDTGHIVITNHLLKKAETASRLHNIAKIAGVDLPIVCINGFKEDEGIWEGEILEALLTQTLESEFERRDEKFVYYKNGEKWLIAHHHIFSQNTIICKVDPKMIFVQQEEVAHNGLICENFNKICPHEKENGNNKDHLIATARKAYKMINNLKENEKIGKDCNKVVLVENQFNLPRAKYVFNYVWNCENTRNIYYSFSLFRGKE